jgi:RNA polymerase sigma-70 factor (ECF subfamily)
MRSLSSTSSAGLETSVPSGPRQSVTEDWLALTEGEDVLVAAAQRDPAAFGPLYDRYVDAVVRFCYIRLDDWPEAEDAASEVFTNVLANLGRFRPREQEDGFRCWLFTIARHVVADRYRRRTRHPEQSLDAVSCISDRSPGPEDVILAADEHRFMRSLLAQLKPAQRDVLELRIAGLKSPAIARILGRTPQVIRQEQSRSIKALRALLQQDAEEGTTHG